jgi:hypothetical protein
MHVFKHPKYYEEFRKRAKRYQKELRERNKSDQAISKSKTVDIGDSVRPDPGLKHQASSVKPQAPEASSDKRQAPSSKRQA